MEDRIADALARLSALTGLLVVMVALPGVVIWSMGALFGLGLRAAGIR